jgi:SAM-dependent methyltransferase
LTPTDAEAPKVPLGLAAATIFLSAFLLFQVQPLVGKLTLPWFGGSAGVWTTCLLFFQVLLLLGYLYAHLVIRHLPHRRQIQLHGTLLALAALALPLRLHAAFKPGGTGDPVLQLLALLGTTVGLPYLLLSTTGPLVQAWVARKGHVPYRLFALSNAASMVALLSYPLLVEPWLSLRVQSWSWSAGFLLFGGLILSLALRSHPDLPTLPAEALEEEAPTLTTKTLWILLAAVPSVLLMAVTSHLSTNVAPIPFLWVLPLALYLLTFILCFEADRWYHRGVFLGLLPLGLAAMTFFLTPGYRHLAVQLQILVFAGGLFLGCMVAHGELARLRPHPRFLTGFYLRLSLGGALGGLFVAWVAPRIFRSYLELPLGLAACAAAALLTLSRNPGPLKQLWLRGAQTLFLLLILGIGAHTLYLGLSADGVVLAQGRNFYGTLSVFDDEGRHWRTLAHGTITHGGQFLDPARARKPVTYYSPDSGVGLALASLPEGPRKVGVVGLGTGSLAAYGRPGDLIRYYDINPLVEDYARRYFTFLKDSPARVEVVMGDARLSLEREAPQAYDLLAIDAFSSDAIPVHLLTREAFGVYLQHLRPGGVLAVHVSNRYLNLHPVVKAAADHFHQGARVVDTESDEATGAYGSTWLLLTADHAFFDRPAFQDNRDVSRLEGSALTWTDDFSNLFRILK